MLEYKGVLSEPNSLSVTSFHLQSNFSLKEEMNAREQHFKRTYFLLLDLHEGKEKEILLMFLIWNENRE
jgi:hypothetical protein